jgi:hypothetical protein
MKLKSIVLLFFMMFGAFLINTNAQSGYGYSYIEATQPDPNGSINIYAESGTVLDYAFNYDYQPGVQPTLFENGYIRDTAAISIAPSGYSSWYLYTNVSANYNATYRLHAEHYVRAKYYYNTSQGPSYRDYWGLNPYQGNYPTPYSFAIHPTQFYSYHTYRAASTEVQINVTRPLHLNSIDQASGVPTAQSFVTTLRGTGLFGSSSSVNVTGSGVTAQISPNQSPNTIEVLQISITIEANAARGERQIALTVNGVASNPLTFTVGDNGPVISNMTPPQANTGETVSVTISGTHFGVNPLIQIGGGGVNSTITGSSPTQITALFSVADATYIGTRGVQVKSRGINGTGFQTTPQTSDLSNSVPFNVTDQPFLVLIRFPEGVVEKNGEATVRFDADTNSSQTVKFTIRRISGTGEATFEDGSIEKSYTGQVSAVETIKGITESSQADNFIIEARVNNSSTIRDQSKFTVAKIDSLVFEQINFNDIPIDNNPGTDGIYSPGEGFRIYPDKINPTDTTDRATLRVKATVSPAIPGLTVYFASFDLDDPSAKGLPVDTTNVDGKDNNGDVNGSKSGEFINPTGGDCLAPETGTSANDYVSKINCTSLTTTASVSSNYKVTMQPGDNFAVAASLSRDYRNYIKVNSISGNELTDYASRVTHINGQVNTANSPGIRTEMLTVWRKLHIEIDSMGAVTGNKVSGTIDSIVQTVCPTPTPTPSPTPTPPTATPTPTPAPTPTPIPCIVSTAYVVTPLVPATALELGRFKDGSIRIDGTTKIYNVDSNQVTNGSQIVVLKGNPALSQKVTTPANFTLYDDDDMNDDDTTRLDGDNNEDVDEPPHSLVSETSTPCLDVATASNCNVFANAYVVPDYTIAGSHENTPFALNVDLANPDSSLPAEIQAHFQFTNVGLEASSDYWTIYMNGAYQHDLERDGDGLDLINPTTSAGGVLGSVDSVTNGRGLLIYMENTRPFEFGNVSGRPVSRNFTVAHEVGHLFYGFHRDLGLMAQTSNRTSSIFSNTSLNKIRGGNFIDENGLTTRITHP